jgi:hypothetical protein
MEGSSLVPHYNPSPLKDATRWNYPFASRSWQPNVQVDHSWDYSMIPSERPLYAVLQDIVRHGVENPTHGTDCACLDTFSYELHAHVNRALPEVERVPVDLDPGEWHEPGDEWADVPGSRDARMKAQFRIAHVLGMVARRL